MTKRFVLFRMAIFFFCGMSSARLCHLEKTSFQSGADTVNGQHGAKKCHYGRTKSKDGTKSAERENGTTEITMVW